MDDFDFGSLVLMMGLLLAPAILVFIILTIIRVRRGRFHRQRITKKKTTSAE